MKSESLSSNLSTPPESLENISQNEAEDITELLTKVTEKGSPDLFEASSIEREKILYWYEHNDLNEKDKVAYMEEFMRYGVIPDSKAVNFVRSMDDDQKEQLGEYIARTIKPGVYVQCFYECWDKIDQETKDGLMKTFKEHPEGSIMVAPFKNLEEFKTDKADVGYSGTIYKSILQTEFYSLEKARKLIDTQIEYFVSHPEIQNEFFVEKRDYEGLPFQGRSFATTRERIRNRRSNFSHPYAVNIENTIDFYLKNRPFILYPYIDKLLELKLLSKENANSLFEITNQYGLDTTEDEENEIKVLTKKLKGSDGENFYFHDAYDATPMYHGIQIQKIRDEGAKRVIHSMLENFSSHKLRFRFDQNKFLLELLDRGAPIFSEIESLGMTKEEIRVLILKSNLERDNFPFTLWEFGDLKSLLEWNQKEKNGPDLEKIIIDLLCTTFTEGEMPSMVIRLREILSWFQEENAKKIIKVINTRAPHLWLLNLDYAIEKKVMPLDELIDKSSTKSPHYYLTHFNNLLYHVSILKKEDKDFAIELDDVRKVARKLILENPASFFSDDFKNVCREAFTEKELETFVDKQLAKEPVDSYFLVKLFYSDYIEKYKDRCRQILVSNPLLFAEVVDNTRSEMVSKILTTKELTSLLIQNVETLDFDKFLDEKTVIDLLKSSANLERLMDALLQSDNSKGLIAVAKILIKIEKSSDSNLTHWKSTHDTTEKDLKRLYKLLRSASPEEKDDLQEKIDKDKVKLVELKNNKPKESRTKDIKQLASGFNTELRDNLKELCESDKFLVFNEGMLTILGNDAENLVKRSIEEYVSIHPDILLRVGSYGDDKQYGKLVFESILGEEEFSRLFMSKIRTLSFWSGRYGRSLDASNLPPNLLREVRDMNPLLAIQLQGKLEEDYYKSAIDIIQNYQFYSLYQSRLNKIAEEEVTIYGPRLEMDSFYPKEEFLSLSKIIFLFENSDLVLRNKEAILSLPEKEKDELTKLLGFITYYHLDEKIDFDLDSESFSTVKDRLLTNILEFSKKLFEIEDVNISTSEPIQMNTINALSIYYNRSCSDNPAMKKAFHEMIVQILAGNYNYWRSGGITKESKDAVDDTEKLEQMKNENLLPQNITLEQYEKWLSARSIDLNETFTYEISDIQSGIREIFSLAVVDRHIEDTLMNVDSHILATDYHELLQPIRELSKRQLELKQRIISAKKSGENGLTSEENIEYENIKDQIKQYREDNEDEIKKIEALRYLDRIRKISIDELETKTLNIDQKKTPLSEAFKTIEEVFKDKVDFLSDIRRIRELLAQGNKQIFQGARVSRSLLTITDEIDLETYTLIGEKPVESCQHYNGSSYNYGLLSYISDPAIKVGQVWDENGNIIARMIMRLMEDDKHDPHLFMERVYSVNTHPKIREALIRFGIEKAKSMGIEAHTEEKEFKHLTGSNTETGSIVLYSRGSRSPFTYTDAGGGKVPNGVFKIEEY